MKNLQPMRRVAVRRGSVMPARPLPPHLRRHAVVASSSSHHAKMHVPSDSFGGMSPEKKAAIALRNLFTFVAAKVILNQLEGPGPSASYNKEAQEVLVDHLQNVAIKDGDDWVAQLMRKNNSLAMRLMEVRQAYCEGDFEWELVHAMATKDTKEANTRLMRQAAMASLLASSPTPTDTPLSSVSE